MKTNEKHDRGAQWDPRAAGIYELAALAIKERDAYDFERTPLGEPSTFPWALYEPGRLLVVPRRLGGDRIEAVKVIVRAPDTYGAGIASDDDDLPSQPRDHEVLFEARTMWSRACMGSVLYVYFHSESDVRRLEHDVLEWTRLALWAAS